MANALYRNYAHLLLGAGTHTLPDWDTNTIKADLIDAADYAANLATDQDHADVTPAGIVASGTLANVAIATGFVDADDLTYTAVSGDESENVIIWQDTATETTSPLMCFFDTFASGMPVTPNGGDITVQWAAGGILALAS